MLIRLDYKAAFQYSALADRQSLSFALSLEVCEANIYFYVSV